MNRQDDEKEIDAKYIEYLENQLLRALAVIKELTYSNFGGLN